MKRALAILILIGLLNLASCAEREESNDKEETSQKDISRYEHITLGMPGDTTLRIYNDILGAFIESPVQNNIIETLKRKFGIDCVFLQFSHTYDPEILKQMNGIFCLYDNFLYGNYENIKKSIIPMDEVFYDPEVSSVIPSFFINDIMDSDGNIWIMPNTLTFRKGVRIFNENIMVLLGAEIPRNIFEYHDLLISVKESNFRGDILRVGISNPLNELSDIFSAFGCNIYHGYSTISWDHATGSYEDEIFSENFLDALEYIEALRDSGIFSFGDGNTRGLFENDGLFTRIIDNGRGTTEKYYSFSLGAQEGYEILEYSPADKYLVIPAGTESPVDDMSNFIKVFIGNPVGNLMGKFGENNVYANYDDINVVKYVGNEPRHELMLSLVDEWITTNPYYQPIVGQTEQAIQLRSKSYQEFCDWIITGLGSGRFVTVPIWSEIKTVPVRNPKLDRIFEEEFSEFLTSGMSAADFMEEYKAKMKNNGGNKYLDNLNETISAITINNY
ncbi:MAG: hypothetical protein R6W99_08445 [Clostridia bacterium]